MQKSDVASKDFAIKFGVTQFRLNILVSRLVSDSESQAQACVLIDGTAPVFAAHSTDGSKTCADKEMQKDMRCWDQAVLSY